MTEVALGDTSSVLSRRLGQSGRFINALLLTAVLFLVLTSLGSHLLADADSQWQVAVGSRIWNGGHVPQVDEFSHTFAGFPWIATEWLSQLLFFGAFRLAGWSGVVILTAFAIAVTFGLLLYWLEGRLKWVTALSIALAVLPSASIQFLARPESLALPLLILFVGAAIDAVENRVRPPLWLVPLMSLWANLHASYPIAFVIFGVLAAEALFAADAAGRLKVACQWGVVFVLLIAATGLTPYGFKPLLITLFVLHDSEAPAHVMEWQPLHVGPELLVTVTALAFVACLALMLVDPRRSLFRIILVLLFAYLMERHIRFANLFAIVSAFAVAYPIRRVFPSLSPHAALLPVRQKAFFLLAPLILVAGLAVAGLSRPSPPRDVAPTDALNAARQLGLSGPVYNDYDFGGFLLASGVKTFIDGRTDQLFVHGFMDRLFRAEDAEHPEALLAILSEYKVTWALVKSRGGSDVKLGGSNDWLQVYRDDIAVVYRKTQTPPPQADGNL